MLGLLLVIMFMNDLPELLEGGYKMFVHYVKLLSETDGVNRLEVDLDNLPSWAVAVDLRVNVGKSQTHDLSFSQTTL